MLHCGIIRIIKRCMLFIENIAEKRQDKWWVTVLEKNHQIIDLPAADAFNH